MAIEALCGAAGVTLGILALAGVLPATMLSIAVITLGAAALLGSGALYFMNLFPARHPEGRSAAQLAAEQAMIASSGTQTLVGVGAVALGVLALVGTHTLVLCTVGLLVLGAGLMVSGSAMVAHAWSVSRS